MAERTIVRYGVYRFTDEERSAYHVRLNAQVIREPSNQSLNVKYPYPQSFYGYAQLMHNNFVFKTIALQYTKQCVYEYFAHDNLSTLYGSAWQYGTVLTISNAVVALGGAPLLVVPSELTFFPMPYDRVVFRLFNDTTMQVWVDAVALPELEGIPTPFDPEADNEPQDSGATPTPNPLDAPYDIPSPAYDPTTNDNGETYNPPLPEPTQGEPGTRQVVRLEYRLPYFYQPPYNPLLVAQTTLTAPIGNYRLREEGRPNAPVWILEVPYGDNQVWSAASGGITPPQYTAEQFCVVENFTVTPE